MSTGPGESGGPLSIVAGGPAGERRDGSAVNDSADRVGTSVPLRISVVDGGTAGDAG